MATSLDALEALLQFREGALTKSRSPMHQLHDMPVPNPLDPTQPHIIEGDAPAPIAKRQAFGSGAKSAFSRKSAMAPVVTEVPNPLETPIAEKSSAQRYSRPLVSAVKPVPPMSSNQNMAISHGFAMTPRTPLTPAVSDTIPRQALEVEVRNDKIRDALHSKPQRGKKRRNLNEYERQELTRTRNREHAKSTRMKKKARHEELMEIEKKYLILKEKEALDLRRQEHLVEFVENIGSAGALAVKDCLHTSRLKELASHEIHKPEFSVTDTVALTAENSGMVKVSAHGIDLESGKSKTLSGVICADFSPQLAVISDVSLYWSFSKSISSSVGIVPSVSVLSFES
ncbi:hypothetical protein ACHAXR_011455 [Thalassiosira sp. AJA248-18]